MNIDDVSKLARDPRFIPGIYNYCDRWCERCPLSHRCLTFAMEEEVGGDDPEKRDIRNQKFWDSLQGVFQMALDMVKEEAAKRGVDLEAPDPGSGSQREAREKREKEIWDKHPLLRGSRRYAQDVQEWFRRAQGALKELGVALDVQAKLGAGDPVAEAGKLQEILQVIRWYQFLIAGKLGRAVTGSLDDDGLDTEDLREEAARDADGSAKVALIAIDRSLAAWTSLREQLASEEDAILDLLVLLARLRKGTEARFPEARSFVRPGFDA